MSYPNGYRISLTLRGHFTSVLDFQQKQKQIKILAKLGVDPVEQLCSSIIIDCIANKLFCREFVSLLISA